jgi:hypothetical protein
MLPSLHDGFLVSYEVDCETRQIKRHAKRDPKAADLASMRLSVIDA